MFRRVLFRSGLFNIKKLVADAAVDYLHRTEGTQATKLGDDVHRSEEHTSELQSPCNLVCRLLLEKTTTRAAPACVSRSARLAAANAWSSRRRSQRLAQARRLGHVTRPARVERLCQFCFFNDPATTEIYTLSLHDALPICVGFALLLREDAQASLHAGATRSVRHARDRKSTRLNSSHLVISYAVFCLN